MCLDHIQLVFWAKKIVGSIVCTLNEYLRCLRLCDLNNIHPLSELYKWEDLPTAWNRLLTG